jgi:hypothetical protein
VAKPPTRFKSQDDLDGDELLEVVQARRAGKNVPRFESAAYIKHKIAKLRAAGLDEEADEIEAETGEPVPLDEQTTEEHFDRLRAGR